MNFMTMMSSEVLTGRSDLAYGTRVPRQCLLSFDLSRCAAIDRFVNSLYHVIFIFMPYHATSTNLLVESGQAG